MSYVVEIIRPIQKHEVLTLASADPELSVAGQGEDWVDLTWAQGEEEARFTFAQGRITVTTPSDTAWRKAQDLAQHLNAEVIGEEDQVPMRTGDTHSGIQVRSTWLGWPALVFVLAALLIWRW